MTNWQFIVIIATFVITVLGFIVSVFAASWITRQDLKQYLDARFEAVNAEFKAVRAEIGSVRTEIGSVRSEVNGLSQRVERIERQLEALFVPKPR